MSRTARAQPARGSRAARLNIWAECSVCEWHWHDDGLPHKTSVTKRATVYAREHCRTTDHDTLLLRVKTFRATPPASEDHE